jgi:hypothetical protein
MQFIQHTLHQLTDWLSPWYSDIGFIFVATLLVIYGDKINKQVKLFLRAYHFILRTAGFVLLCGFGYGMLLLWLSPALKDLLLMLPSMYRGLAIVLAFIGLGMLADKRRYI